MFSSNIVSRQEQCVSSSVSVFIRAVTCSVLVQPAVLQSHSLTTAVTLQSIPCTAVWSNINCCKILLIWNTAAINTLTNSFFYCWKLFLFIKFILILQYFQKDLNFWCKISSEMCRCLQYYQMLHNLLTLINSNSLRTDTSSWHSPTTLVQENQFHFLWTWILKTFVVCKMHSVLCLSKN